MKKQTIGLALTTVSVVCLLLVNSNLVKFENVNGLNFLLGAVCFVSVLTAVEDE